MEQTQTNNYLEQEKLGKLMCKYAIPCVISLLVAALYNIVDQIFIANASYLGSYGNAANTVVFPVTVAALAIATLVGDGCCTFVSISLGAKENENAHRGIGSSVITIIAAGVLLMLIYLIFQEPILTAFGAKVNEETFQLSKEYFFWITIGIPFYMFGQAMNPIIRSDGSPWFAMGTLLTGAILNIILDPICIFVFKWGMMGAAVATIFGQIVSAILSAVYLKKMKLVRLNKDSFKFRGSLMKKILPLGITSFLSQISMVLSLAAVLNMVTKYGAKDPIFGQADYAQIPTAIVGIVIKFFQIVMSISIGLAAGCIPVSGYNMGARRYDRVKQLMKLLLIVEVIVGVVASVLFLLFPNQFIQLFGAKDESIYYTEFAVKAIRSLLCLLPLSCLNKGTCIFLQSLGKAKESTILSLLREIVFGVGIPLLFPIFMGLDGVLLYIPAADILTAIASVIILILTHKSLSRRDETGKAEDVAMERQEHGDARTDYIITIGRSYGAGGRSIGKKVAEQLHIPYYDSELLEKAAQSSGLSRKFLQSVDEKPVDSSMLYRSVGFGVSGYETIAHQARKAQREIIETVAAEGPCVIVGRCADQILAQNYKLLRVFITAGEESRIQRVMKRDNLNEENAKKMLAKVNKERSSYYNQRSDTRWGDAAGYDLCIDTDWFGMDGAVDLITKMVEHDAE